MESSSEGGHMRSARFVLLLVFLLIRFPAWGQQSQSGTSNSAGTTPLHATKDPQAVAVLNQALTVAGGGTAIKAITDYTATGNMIYHWNPEAQGTVTILGLGLNQIRIDANLPRGIRSSVLSNGQTTTKAEDGSIKQYPPPYPTPSSEAFPYQPPMFPGSLLFPHAQIVFALNSSSYSVLDKGLVQVDGHSAHEIALQADLPGPIDPMSQYHTRDIFLDASTSQVLMTQDVAPGNVIRAVLYSDYRAVNGVLVPFSIKEQVAGQETWSIQLNQLGFNTGLQDASFIVR